MQVKRGASDFFVFQKVKLFCTSVLLHVTSLIRLTVKKHPRERLWTIYKVSRMLINDPNYQYKTNDIRKSIEYSDKK